MREAEEMVVFHHFCTVEYSRGSRKPAERRCCVQEFRQFDNDLLAS